MINRYQMEILGEAMACHPAMLLQMRDYSWECYRDDLEREQKWNARASLQVIRAAQEQLESLGAFGNLQSACMI